MRQNSIRLRTVAIAALATLVSSNGLFAAVRTWTGGGTSNNWSEAANWSGNVVPVFNDDLTFPAGVSKVVMNNNINVRSFRSISFDGSGYELNGNVVRFSGNLTASGANASHRVNVAMQLIGSVTCIIQVDASAQLFLMKTIAGGRELAKRGEGRLLLAGNNSFAGQFSIIAGVVELAHNNALGSATAATVVFAGSAIELGEFIPTGSEFPKNLVVPEPLSLLGTGVQNSGALRCVGGNHTWNGTITLGAGINNSIGVELQADPFTPDQLTINSVIADAAVGGMRKVGGGRLILTGTNTYRGTTNIDQGVLTMQNSSALGDTSGITRVSSGAALEVASLPIGGNEEIPVSSSEALQLFGNGILNGGALRNVHGLNSWQGPIQLMTSTTVGVDQASDLFVISAQISGSGNGLTKVGPGELLFSHDNSYSGRTVIRDGTLTVNAVQAASAVQITNGTLQGIGTVGAVNVLPNGVVSPAGTNTGILTVQGGFATRGSLRADIGDRLRVFGAVNLTNSVISLFGGTAGKGSMLIENDLTDAVIGSTNGAILTATSGQVFKLNYNSGSGNDVTLQKQL